MPNTQVTTAATHSSTTPPINGNKAMMWYGIAVLVMIIDQLTKLYFEHNYQLYQTTPIIEPIFNFTLGHNYGAAFSFLADKGGWQKWLFSGLALAVSLCLMAYLRKIPQQAKLLALGLSLVIDFLHVHYGDAWHFPIFNMADVAINIGVALILIDAFLLESKRNTL
jgi:signal peptidase II